MFDCFLNTLAISVSELDPVQTDNDEKQKVIWIIALAAVIVICIALSRIKLDLGKKIAAKKDENTRKKAEKKRDEELERLHEIKRKNQRK